MTSTVCISIRFILEAVLQDVMGNMVQRSLDGNSFWFEFYLLASTMATEVMAYYSLLYSVMHRRSQRGWAKIEASLELDVEYAPIDSFILE